MVVLAPLAGATDSVVDPVGVALALFAAVCQAAFFLIAGRGWAPMPNLHVSTSSSHGLGRGCAFDAPRWPDRAASSCYAIRAARARGSGSWPARITGAAIPTTAVHDRHRLHRPSRAAILMTIEPLVGVTIAALFLGEEPSLIQIIGGAAVLDRRGHPAGRAAPLRPATRRAGAGTARLDMRIARAHGEVGDPRLYSRPTTTDRRATSAPAQASASDTLAIEQQRYVLRVRKAVFPAAGWGTRFLPATKAQPKEMLPLVDKPVIQYGVEEAVAAGIEQVIIVTSSQKRAIEDHFDHNYELEQLLEAKGDIDDAARVRQIGDMVQISYVRQKEQLGLGHAVLMAKEAIGHEPFAVILSDDVVVGDRPCIGQLIDAYHRTHGSVVAVMEVPDGGQPLRRDRSGQRR